MGRWRRAISEVLELGRLAFLDRSPPDREVPVPPLRAIVREAEEIERLGLSETTLRPLLSGEPPEADQARLLGVEREAELDQALLQVFPEALGVGLMLKPQHDIIGIPHGDHLAASVPRPPLLDPQIEHVVQIDVGQQR
jgi:hypothetical protein